MPLINRIILSIIAVGIVTTATMAWVLYFKPLFESPIGPTKVVQVEVKDTDLDQPVETQSPESPADAVEVKLREKTEAQAEGLELRLESIQVRNVGFPFGELRIVRLSVRIGQTEHMVHLSRSAAEGYQDAPTARIDGYELELMKAQTVGEKEAVITIRQMPA